MREAWLGRERQGAAIAAPVTLVPFGSKRGPVSLIVDLAEDIGSKRWWRGAATLGALALALGLLAPGFEPLPSRKGASLPRVITKEWHAGGIATP